jgi:hypothetical protein
MPRFPLLVSLCLLAACATQRAATITGPGMNAKREASLMTLASGKISCDAGLLTGAFIESLERNFHLYRATGCGQTFEVFLLCVPMGGCQWVETPDTRAAFDLQCAKEKLSRTYLGSGTFGVAGCDRTITYVWVNGQYVANTVSSGLKGEPPPQKQLGTGSSSSL